MVFKTEMFKPTFNLVLERIERHNNKGGYTYVDSF